MVAEKFVRDLGLDRDKVNGGSIALGHLIGVTGSMLIGTILDELKRRDLKRGLVTMCAAGGMAPAADALHAGALERHHRSGLECPKTQLHLPLTRESSIFLRAGVGQGGSGLLTPSVVTTASRISAHASLKR